MNSVISKEVEVLKLGEIKFKDAWERQEEKFNSIIDTKIYNRKSKSQKKTKNYIITCSHPHVYTLGKSGNEKNLLIDNEEIERRNLEYYKINRGGDITYHGPGQLVIYPIIDLENFFTDIHKYLRYLEESIILTLKEYNIESGRVEGLTGVWINHKKNNPKKICALGVKTSRWVTMHGLAFNISPELKYFKNIIPCGIENKDVTSLEKEFNKKVSLEEVEKKVIENLSKVFDFKIL
ncbi:MAG: lipoyl(octanoyl) transferase [Flammeovirgaceae bacterium]|nr:lipoyl(octanoyl) transferase [Flammeovirgaceae bacterium]